MNNKNNIDRVHDDVFNSIKTLMDKARNEVAREVNNILVQTYWEIGRIIVEDEQGHSERAEYGKELINDLSRQLTKEYGKGFSKSNLFNMRNLYLSYPIFQTLSGKLTWSHYCELLSISDEKKRSFYEKEIIKALEKSREVDNEEEQKFIMDKIYEDQIRVEDLTKKIERLYDDWLDNKISESNFQNILEKSQNEQDYLNQRIEDNQKLIVKDDLEDINVKKWIELIKKHRDIKKLDKETLNELISKIYVHEKEVVNGEITQTIDIYYNFIGNTDTLQVFYNL
ncbi:TPA: DUF1016 N-terminal domain-containing protein [Streptococcus agalactiae]